MNRLKKIRQQRKETLCQVSKNSGVCASQLSRFEHGESIGLVRAQRIAKALGTTPADIWPDKFGPAKP